MSRSSTWSAERVFGPYTLAALIWRADVKCTWCTRIVCTHVRPKPNRYTIDHVIPRARGGSDEPKNLVLACSECNLLRGGSAVLCPAPLLWRMRRRGGWGKNLIGDVLMEIGRQTMIPVGRGTEANKAARGLAERWFGAAIEKDLALARAYKARIRGSVPSELPF